MSIAKIVLKSISTFALNIWKNFCFLDASFWKGKGREKGRGKGKEKKIGKKEKAYTSPLSPFLSRNSNDDTQLGSVSQKGNTVQLVKALRTFSLFLLFMPLYSCKCSTVLDAVKYMQYNIISVLTSSYYPCKQDRTSYYEKGKDTVQMTARWWW